jgi:hypothetical protein
MTLDEALVNVSHNQSTNEFHYGKQDALWNKTAQIASLKLSRSVSVQEAIIMHIAFLEAKVSIKPSIINNMMDIMGLYGLLSGTVETSSVSDEVLDKIEHEIRESLPMPKAEPMDTDHA